jgi:hypothetical protein
MVKADENVTREQQLASIWNFKFKHAMIAKAEQTKLWQTYRDAYNGDYFKNANLPEYRSNMVSNYIFSIIETIRPIMLDNDPKFQAMPRQESGMEFANDLQEAFLFEWDRENMNRQLYKELINTLVIGTSVFFLPWNSEEKEVNAIPVSPFNIFPDPLATTVEDAEYIIYASYHNVERLKEMFPDKSEVLSGGDINYGELVHDNNKTATNINNQVLVLECWTKDYDTEEKIHDDLKVVKRKYPNGRVITVCPELGIVLSDKANPYKSSNNKKQRPFPFVLIKNYDIPGKFWGEGEVAQLLSPQKYMNELNNSIIDNAKTTANMPWIVDQNSGVGVGKITARPGLVIRKNPGTEVKREQPPNMPNYVVNAVETYKNDMEMISGVHNTLRGENSSGVYTAQGILALQEAGTVRVRLKVKLLEDALGMMANMWLDRMKQFWKEERWITITKPDGSYDLKKFTTNKLEHDYDIKVMAGSTMASNRGAMLDLMIRLAQTQMPDGQPLVDRDAVVHYLPEEIKAPLLKRMSENQSSLAEIENSIEQIIQVIDETNQAIEQVANEGNKNDEEQFVLIEELLASVEELNKQILQLQEEYDKMLAEDEKRKKEQEMQDKYYNEGYKDAEELYTDIFSEDGGMPGLESTGLEENILEDGIEESPGIDDLEALFSGEIPDEILSALETMDDEELLTLIEEYPQLAEILR